MKQPLRGSHAGNIVPNAGYQPHLTSVWNKLSEYSKDVVRQLRKDVK